VGIGLIGTVSATVAAWSVTRPSEAGTASGTEPSEDASVDDQRLTRPHSAGGPAYPTPTSGRTRGRCSPSRSPERCSRLRSGQGFA
jgi:hypothetical protein